MSNEPEFTPTPHDEPEIDLTTHDEPEFTTGPIDQTPAITADPTPPALPPPALPPPPPPAPVGAAARFISNAMLMVLGAVLAAGGYALATAFVPPRPPSEVTAGADAVKPTDLKKLSERDENLEANFDGLSKRIDMLPNPGPELKTLNDQDEANTQKLAALATRLDAIDERLNQTSPGSPQAIKPQFDALSKRLDEFEQKLAGGTRPAANPRPAPNLAAPEDVNVEGRAMEQAATLYKDKKYAEAHAAFTKLQSVFPDDARVWYYSALANGFATKQWTGETERLVNAGLEKEKAGSPPADKIDAVFADLSSATGKDWLTAYRKRIAR